MYTGKSVTRRGHPGRALLIRPSRRALLAGKHVFTEKLLCFNLEEGKELVRIAKEKNLYLGVAPDTFLGAGLQTARKVLDSGLIGKPTSCVACINRNQALNSEGFRYIRYTGGSFPYDIGVYYMTALLSLLGPVKKLAGFAAPAPTHQGRMFWNGNYGEEWDLVGNNIQAGSLLFENLARIAEMEAMEFIRWDASLGTKWAGDKGTVENGRVCIDAEKIPELWGHCHCH